MPDYRSLRVLGACYFFTVNLADRRSDRLTQNIDALRRAAAMTRKQHPFVIDACVVLPNHPCRLDAPEGDCDFSTRWPAIKRLFSWQIAENEDRSTSHIARRERGIWQRRFWEHVIRDDVDFRAHGEYVHFNPVRHGLVGHPRLWPYSTYHRAGASSELEPAWALAANTEEAFGERANP